MLSSILISLTEVMVLTVTVILLYTYRYIIGAAGVYLMAGVFYIFTLLTDSPRFINDTTAISFFNDMGSGLLWLPFLLLFIIIYEQEGARPARRFYVGLFVATATFFFLMLLVFGVAASRSHLFPEFFSVSRDFFKNTGRMSILVSSLCHLFIFAIIPTIYQVTANRWHNHGIAIFVTCIIYLAIDEAFVAIYAASVGGVRAYQPVSTTIGAIRIATSATLSILGHIYFNIYPAVNTTRKRSPLGFLSGFFRGFNSTEKLMQSLDEWEERYQVVVENSSELIMLATPSGQLLNANRAATKRFRKVLNDPDFRLDRYITDATGNPWNWQEAMPAQDIHDPVHLRSIKQYRNLFLRIPGKRPVDLDINVSGATLNGENIAVIIAHDMTLQREEQRQNRYRSEAMMHSQRLESIGQLAGGIAHDFNNMMLSIQASLDALSLKYHPDGEAGHLLKNIEDACIRATTLTSQLLGFAHKGKFHAEDVEVPALLQHATQLFLPTAKGITCKTICEPVPLLIHCDDSQLTQVILNLLINSRDALANTPDPRRITIRAESVRDKLPEWDFRPDRDASPDDYLCIQIRDNGCGMSSAVKAHMFDPFFTTKDAGHGTGMGLAMAFGCIANHNGWIHVESAPEQGCCITIFLPRAGTDAAESASDQQDESNPPPNNSIS
ncbi:MAG: hypothetical protein IKS83_03325 [Victivallales bacterium]|nr:hypothetical protein [Victivallales bacterium]